MTEYVWPDPEGILAYLSDLMARDGAELKVRSPDDVTAGFARARTALDYTPDATAFDLAALMFDGIATRHPLVDGNKRLAWLGAVVFLDLNGWYLDAPEIASFEIGMAVIGRKSSVEDLAAFFRAHCIEDS
ncbi:MAG: type II toxin-antitoxin system death-on-curing family toxin [Pseudomonadota bacterium]